MPEINYFYLKIVVDLTSYIYIIYLKLALKYYLSVSMDAIPQQRRLNGMSLMNHLRWLYLKYQVAMTFVSI
ncbi:MAG: hypothetical protein HQK99_17260 [Nitrospirae bacterium]|nr:hypothetical protein [Nitrospirota bacterium]